MKVGEIRPLTHDGLTDWVTVMSMGQGNRVHVLFRSGSKLTVDASLLGATPSTRTPRDFLTHLGGDGGHAAPRMVRAT